MNSRRLVPLAIAAVGLLAFVAFWLRSRSNPHRDDASAAKPAWVASAPVRNAKLAALAAEITPDAMSPIANELNAPDGTARRDLEILNDVLVAWQTNFPQEGNPTGENDEITLALAGENRLRFAFIAPNHRAINARGELCDRWSTPYRFHALSGTQMELRSAGPDRKFGTPDDVEFALWPRQL